jgi:hypothetical protein
MSGVGRLTLGFDCMLLLSSVRQGCVVLTEGIVCKYADYLYASI